ncbi:MAG: SMP-30/gluconolactonase/LRE family protein [Burkholderiaceae bacterium]
MEILNPLLEPVVQGAVLERLCTGAVWSEGPVWMHEDDSVLWSDIPNNRMLRWSVAEGLTVWRENVEFTNGHTRDLNGDLLHCSHGLRAIMRTRVSGDGVRSEMPDEIVVDHFQGGRLNSPNDVVVRSDGTIWFTDPPYGILGDLEGRKAAREQQVNHVFCFDPRTQTLHAATSEVDEPNGLCFSPDERVLYVSDTSAALRSGNHHIVAFDVNGYRLHNMRVVAQIDPGLPDGFRIDRHGWIYTSSEDSVQILTPDGTRLGRIPIPEKVGNLTFGGREHNQLFIVASTSLYRTVLNTQGLQRP